MLGLVLLPLDLLTLGSLVLPLQIILLLRLQHKLGKTNPLHWRMGRPLVLQSLLRSLLQR